MGGAAVGVDVVVGPDLLVAVLLDVGRAGGASAAAADDHPRADYVPGLKPRHFRSSLHHFSYHFVPARDKSKFGGRRESQVWMERERERVNSLTRAPWGTWTRQDGS